MSKVKNRAPQEPTSVALDLSLLFTAQTVFKASDRNLFNALFPMHRMTAQIKPEWIKTKPQELEALVVSLHKEGNMPAKIGLILRDKHGIPTAKLLGQSIAQLLREAKLSPTSEATIVEQKIQKIKLHLAKHKHDYTAKRSQTKKQWIITKLKN